MTAATRVLAALVLAAGLAGTARAEPTSLVDAIRTGDRASALALIEQGADVDGAQPDGSSALLWAVYHVDVDLARRLIERGAHADRPNDFGAAPLTEAVKVANLELVRMLLKAGAKVDVANGDDQTPLFIAARMGALDVVEELVNHGANVNRREQWRQQTPLILAAGGGHAEVVEFLIRHKADVNVRSFNNDWGNQVTSEPRAQYRPTGGLTPLLYTARVGCIRCADALVKAGAGIDTPNPDGITPLMVAIDNGHFELAQHLLGKGANPHLTDWWGRSTLYIATDVRSTQWPRDATPEGGKPDALGMMKVLLDAGVDPNTQLNMHRPAKGGNGRFVDDLLTIGATPLLLAAVTFDAEACDLLLKRGALVNLPNGMGVTPVMAASGLGLSIRDNRVKFEDHAQERAIGTLKVLLAAGADVNQRITDTTGHTARIARPSTMTTRQGQTAIFGAINWSWPQVVRFLLDNGASTDVTDAAGKTVKDALIGNAGGRDHKNNEEIQKMVAAAMTRPGG